MKKNIKHLIGKPSTFTFPGRQKLALAFIAKILEENSDIRNIINLGPGALELPFFHWFLTKVAGLDSSEIKLTGLELNKTLVILGNWLLLGQLLTLSNLRNLATNYKQDEDGKDVIMPNSDLTAKGFNGSMELIEEMFGSTPFRYYEDVDAIGLVHSVGSEFATLTQANVMETDFSEFQDVDLFFLGALLVNLRKSHSDEEVERFVSNLLKSSCKSLVFSATPSDLNKEYNTIQLVQNAGFNVLVITFNKLVVLEANSHIVGDLSVVAVRPGEEYRVEKLIDNIQNILVQEFGEPGRILGFDFESFCSMPVSTLAWVKRGNFVDHFDTEFMNSMIEMDGYQYRNDFLRACLQAFGYWQNTT